MPTSFRGASRSTFSTENEEHTTIVLMMSGYEIPVKNPFLFTKSLEELFKKIHSK